MKRGMRFLALLLLLAALAAPASAERLLTAADLHLQDGSDALAPALAALRTALADCDVLILLGDNTNNGKPAEHEAVLRWAEEAREASGAEIYILPGNHDLWTAEDQKEFTVLYGAYGYDPAFSRDAASASCAVMTEGGSCLLLLDTNGMDAAGGTLPNGTISGETLAWAESTLAGLPEGTPVIACGHHPILPAGREKRTPGADALADLLRARGVRLYLCGHDHGFATVAEGSLRQITVGQPQSYPGWCGVLQRTEEGLAWRVRSLYAPEDPVFESMRAGSEALALQMGSGTLKGTPFEGDAGAIEWFRKAFMLRAEGILTPEICGELLADENCAKWRQAETRTVVKQWILDLLEHCPEDVREISF